MNKPARMGGYVDKESRKRIHKRLVLFGDYSKEIMDIFSDVITYIHGYLPYHTFKSHHVQFYSLFLAMSYSSEYRGVGPSEIFATLREQQHKDLEVGFVNVMAIHRQFMVSFTPLDNIVLSDIQKRIKRPFFLKRWIKRFFSRKDF